MRPKVAYQPAADERLLLPPRSGFDPEDRIYVQDLAVFLNVGQGTITVFCRRLRLLRYARGIPRNKKLGWVTPYGAMRTIAYFRAVEGEKAACGIDHGLRTEKERAHAERVRARRRLRRIQSSALNKR